MTIEDYVYRNQILAALNNNVILFQDGSFRSQVEWFNQEDLLRTMKRMNKGMEKSRRRFSSCQKQIRITDSKLNLSGDYDFSTCKEHKILPKYYEKSSLIKI